jgi:glucose 1-dehydrogenase
VAFAREGADVVINYNRSRDDAVKVVDEIRGMGRRSHAISADIGAPGAACTLVAEAAEILGRLDILVNNAAVSVREPFLHTTEEQVEQVMSVTFTGAFFAAQEAARVMVEQGNGGRILNISSIHEDVAFLHHASYAAAKGALQMFTRTVCQELAPFGITVNNITPGAIASGGNAPGEADERSLSALRAMIPLMRLGEPEEVAALAVFLASDEAAYVTGASYPVDGGMPHWNLGL